MIDKNKAATFSVTLFIALAAGHLMQYGFAFAGKTSSPVTKNEMTPSPENKQEVLGAVSVIPLNTHQI